VWLYELYFFFWYFFFLCDYMCSKVSQSFGSSSLSSSSSQSNKIVSNARLSGEGIHMVKDTGLELPSNASRRLLPPPKPLNFNIKKFMNDRHNYRDDDFGGGEKRGKSDLSSIFPAFVPQNNGGEEIYIPAVPPPPLGENEKLVEIR
jgi:hypothetical protein